MTLNVWATTWGPAYPYTQKIDGQKVTIKAYSYAPYSGSPMIGTTKVFFKNKLLYTIDKYYRERIFTSKDGHFLAVVRTSNAEGVSSFVTFRPEKIDFNQTAIEIFKDGKPFKEFQLKDIIDTAKLANNGKFFFWGYYVDFEAFQDAEFACEACLEVYGKKILSKCDTSEIYINECEECRRDCDLVKLKEAEDRIYHNSMYVRNNSLFVLTNQKTVVKLDFSIFEIQQIPFDEIIPDKKRFNPPKFKRKYKKVKLPDKFDQPKLKDGRSFEKGVADLLGLSISDHGEKETYTVFISNLVIDRTGKCIGFEGKVCDERISEYLTEESINKEMTEKVCKWLMKQKFQTKLIPKRFEKYSFLCIVNLK